MTDTAKRRRVAVDWDAVERDYRTTKLTDTELSTKHKVSREAIVRRRNKDQQRDASRWQRDLAPEVRRATNALLLKETVTEQITAGHRQVTDAVISAAEVNKQVILKHRAWLRTIAEDVATMRDKVLTLAANVTDVREAAVAMGAIESMMRVAKTAIEKERQAFAIDDDSRDTSDATPVDWASMPPADCQVAVIGLLKGR